MCSLELIEVILQHEHEIKISNLPTFYQILKYFLYEIHAKNSFKFAISSPHLNQFKENFINEKLHFFSQWNAQQIGWIKKSVKFNIPSFSDDLTASKTLKLMKNDTLTVLENHVFLTGIILFTQRYFKISVPIWIGYQRLLENQKSFGKAFIDTLEQIPSDEIVRFGKRLQEQDWEEERNEKAEAFMKSKMKSSIFKFKFDHSNPKKSFLQSLESVFR